MFDQFLTGQMHTSSAFPVCSRVLTIFGSSHPLYSPVSLTFRKWHTLSLEPRNPRLPTRPYHIRLERPTTLCHQFFAEFSLRGDDLDRSHFDRLSLPRFTE